jgi:hypothetical protein
MSENLVHDVEAMFHSQDTLVEDDSHQLHDIARPRLQNARQKFAPNRWTVEVEMEVIVLLVALIHNAVVEVDAFRVGLDGFDRG